MSLKPSWAHVRTMLPTLTPLCRLEVKEGGTPYRFLLDLATQPASQEEAGAITNILCRAQLAHDLIALKDGVTADLTASPVSIVKSKTTGLMLDNVHASLRALCLISGQAVPRLSLAALHLCIKHQLIPLMTALAASIVMEVSRRCTKCLNPLKP